jgi:signal transduction histidine kinase
MPSDTDGTQDRGRLERLERAAPAWFRVIPLLLISGLLAVLVLVPVEMGRRREALRHQIGVVISPAQAALLESEAAFAYEVAVYRGYLATGGGAWLDTLRDSHARHVRATARYRELAARVGPELRNQAVELERRRQAWLAYPAALLSGSATRPALVAQLPRSDVLLQEALSASEAVNQALLRIDADLRTRIRQNDARERRMVALLGVAAAVVAALVGWLTVRLGHLMRALEEERARQAQARSTAEAAVRTRDEVLRVVSHDLKNPLHTIGMVAELLVEVPLSEEQRVAKLGIIRRTVDRAKGLVLDLLDAARLETGEGIPVHPAPVACADLVRDAVEIIQVQAAEKKQQVSWSVPDESGSVLADRDRILQVFANLMGNAVKFTPPGGTIDVQARLDGPGAVCFRVRDTGPGIPPEHLPNLFTPFWQARESAALGTGLGLTVAKAIVEAHGGHISAASDPGAGATFSFTVPRAA